ncbi:MAG TPA: TMEM165/GDT1 family protein [Acidimicrobiales bacterium]|jgi:putative Ca2+/H+ antiporter (TMEM165/GDT1 family)
MNVGAFLGIFALMFLLELPDKTMIAMIVMSTRARPTSIVLGASAAFVLQTAIAVSAGGLISLLPAHVKDVIVAVLFLGGALYLLFVPESTVSEEGTREATSEHASTRTREMLTAFGVIFIGEFGDLTQIQAVNFSAKTHRPVEVFFAASAALVCVTFVAAYGGQLLQRVVPIAKIRILGGLVFLGLGVYTLVQLASS